MLATLFTNIKLLVNSPQQNELLRGKELAHLPCIENAWLLIEDDEIVAYGRMEELLSTVNHQPSSTFDLSGQMILPACLLLPIASMPW